ncbi:hypothetical protein Tco_0220410, partial [Tanacetum coccineum]
MLHGLNQLMERKECGGIYLLWVSLIGDVRTLMIDEAHASRYLVNSGADIATYVSNYLTRLKVNAGTSKTF